MKIKLKIQVKKLKTNLENKVKLMMLLYAVIYCLANENCLELSVGVLQLQLLFAGLLRCITSAILIVVADIRSIGLELSVGILLLLLLLIELLVSLLLLY